MKNWLWRDCFAFSFFKSKLVWLLFLHLLVYIAKVESMITSFFSQVEIVNHPLSIDLRSEILLFLRENVLGVCFCFYNCLMLYFKFFPFAIGLF